MVATPSFTSYTTLSYAIVSPCPDPAASAAVTDAMELQEIRRSFHPHGHPRDDDEHVVVLDGAVAEQRRLHFLDHLVGGLDLTDDPGQYTPVETELALDLGERRERDDGHGGPVLRDEARGEPGLREGDDRLRVEQARGLTRRLRHR